MECTITYTAIILGQELDIEFTADCCMDNTGIGSYEYMGFNGYDKGYEYADLNSAVSWDESLYDTWQNAEIKKLSESNNVINQILKTYEYEKSNY
jgi:hypothetical protein